jgi:hypothetical protein
MNHKIVEKLRPHVTTFSGAICNHHFHGDEIKVGGEILNIIDFSKILEDEKKMVQIEIDDAVGVISILIPGVAFNYYNTKYEFKENDLIIATGKVYRPEGSKEECNIPSVLCWDMYPLDI